MLLNESSNATLLSFLNLLADQLQIEELNSLDEAPNLIPILLQFIKSGDLLFVCDQQERNFHNATEFIRNELGENFVDQLNPESADQADKQEMANILLALFYALRLLQEAKFYDLCARLDSVNQSRITTMIERLDNVDRLSSIPYSSILNSSSSATDLANKKNSLGSIQIFSSPGVAVQPSISDEDATKYKVKAAELEVKLKQVEALNSKLNDQLGTMQTEYNELENRHETLKHNNSLKQETIERLQVQVKEIADEAETARYQNSQLQREVKSAKERLGRETQKLAAEMKGKEEENRLLYTRLDELVKQLTEKESSENKVRFLEQQMANQQGTVKELRDSLEGAIQRANIAETELRKQAKLNLSSVTSAGNEDSRNGPFAVNTSPSAETALSLHDELNSTYMTAISQNGFNSPRESPSQHNSSSAAATISDEEIVQLRTQLEVLQYENRQLRKSCDENNQKLAQMESADSASSLEKAKEIERLRQECESVRNEAQKLRQREATAQDKAKVLGEENTRLQQSQGKLEDSLDKAARVIEEYSNASGEHCSAAELLHVQHELERVQTENQRLLAKMDQFKHEATQEQRLITQHWYQSQRDLLFARHTLGQPASSTPSSMRSSLVDNLRSSTPNNNPHPLQQQHSSPEDSSRQSSSSAQPKSSLLQRMTSPTSSSSTLLYRWLPGGLLFLLLLAILLYSLDEFELQIGFGDSA